jgi:hypothetical protein
MSSGRVFKSPIFYLVSKGIPAALACLMAILAKSGLYELNIDA